LAVLFAAAAGLHVLMLSDFFAFPLELAGSGKDSLTSVGHGRAFIGISGPAFTRISCGQGQTRWFQEGRRAFWEVTDDPIVSRAA
jgi:hypothetical protein